MMSQSESTREWDLGHIVLDWTERDGCLSLRQQTSQENLLSVLVHVAYPAAAHCALDILVAPLMDPSIRVNPVDYYDALEAYSGRPLTPVPMTYRDLFYRLDVPNNPTKQAAAIVLSGSPDPQEQELLLSLIRTCPGDMRDAPLFAASSFRDARFVQAVAEVAMACSEDDLLAWGELGVFTTCFRRWIDRDDMPRTMIEEILGAYEDVRHGKMSVGRMMNNIECPEYWRAPYPDEARA